MTSESFTCPSHLTLIHSCSPVSTLPHQPFIYLSGLLSFPCRMFILSHFVAFQTLNPASILLPGNWLWICTFLPALFIPCTISVTFGLSFSFDWTLYSCQYVGLLSLYQKIPDIFLSFIWIWVLFLVASSSPTMLACHDKYVFLSIYFPRNISFFMGPPSAVSQTVKQQRQQSWWHSPEPEDWHLNNCQTR